MMLLVSAVRPKSDHVTRSKPFVSKSVGEWGAKGSCTDCSSCDPGCSSCQASAIPLTCGAADTAYPVRLALESLGFIVSAALFCTIAGAQHHASGVFIGTLQASDDILACSPWHPIR